MSDLQQFRLPDIGEGLTEADIISWRVHPGDHVAVNQTLVEIETAKAVVELPSPFSGVVSQLLVAEGETVDVGRPIITIDVAGVGSAVGSAVGAAVGAAVEVPGGTTMAGNREPMLVGYGPRTNATSGRRSRAPAGVAASVSPTAADVPLEEPSASPAEDDALVAAPSERPALAKPPVRLLAKNLGVALDSVVASGPNGTVLRADVEYAAAHRTPDRNGRPVGPAAASGVPTASETRVPIRGVRKHMAEAMVSSAFTAPHVTEFVTIDVTPMMELRERIAARREFGGLRVSPLLLVARALIRAVARTPEINASWDDAAGEIVLKHYVNLGIAAATPRGLIVPNIKHAEQLSLLELAGAMNELVEQARAGRTAPADLTGGTITITNIGVFGIDTGTPILNPGESGILAFGAVRRMPWVVDEQVIPRWVTQLAVSFDHRIVDGQQGSRFLADVAEVLADPGLALL